MSFDIRAHDCSSCKKIDSCILYPVLTLCVKAYGEGMGPLTELVLARLPKQPDSRHRYLWVRTAFMVVGIHDTKGVRELVRVLLDRASDREETEGFIEQISHAMRDELGKVMLQHMMELGKAFGQVPEEVPEITPGNFSLESWGNGVNVRH